MIRSHFAEQKRDPNAFGRALAQLFRGEDTLEAEAAASGLAQALNALRGTD